MGGRTCTCSVSSGVSDWLGSSVAASGSALGWVQDPSGLPQVTVCSPSQQFCAGHLESGSPAVFGLRAALCPLPLPPTALPPLPPPVPPTPVPTSTPQPCPQPSQPCVYFALRPPGGLAGSCLRLAAPLLVGLARAHLNPAPRSTPEGPPQRLLSTAAVSPKQIMKAVKQAALPAALPAARTADAVPSPQLRPCCCLRPPWCSCRRPPCCPVPRPCSQSQVPPHSSCPATW